MGLGSRKSVSKEIEGRRNVRDWAQVIWAVSTRVDPVRDTLLVDRTPIDYLDFSSPVPSLGSKMGLDATRKLPGETTRAWSEPIVPDAEVARRMEALWERLAAEAASALS